MKRNIRTEIGAGVGRAFTIIEVIVIITIIGIIAAVVAPRLIGHIGGAKQARAKNDMSTLANQIRIYTTDCGKPESGATIDILWTNEANIAGWKGPYVENAEALIDPWGNKYILMIPPKKNADFDIVCYGSDGQPDGEGEAADITIP